MGLYDLVVAVLMLVNAVAILNEERFLAKYGWSYHELAANGMPGAAQSMKGQILGVINAVSYMRMPLAAINFVVIFVKLIFG